MVGRFWKLPDVGRLTVQVPDVAMGARVDELWRSHRPAKHSNLHWSWSKLMREHAERLALLTADGDVLALWTSEKHRPLRLPDGSFFRLDYIERDPRLSGALPGAFAFALVCARALELGCDGLVLASLPEVTRFYEQMGGEQRTARGWRPHRSLVPFVFGADTLRELKEDADEFQVEE